jgi:cell division protein FtsN
MKKLLIILSIITLLSCGKNKAKEEVETPINTEAVELQNKLNETITKLEDCQTQLNAEEVDTNKYYIVVGAFKAEWRADKYISKIEELGYSVKKIFSHYQFYNVYVKAGTNKQDALVILENVRMYVTPRAWIYIKE